MVICHLLAGGTCLPIQPISPFCLFNPYKHVISLNTKCLSLSQANWWLGTGYKCLHTSAMKFFLNFLFFKFFGEGYSSYPTQCFTSTKNKMFGL